MKKVLIPILAAVVVLIAETTETPVMCADTSAGAAQSDSPAAQDADDGLKTLTADTESSIDPLLLQVYEKLKPLFDDLTPAPLVEYPKSCQSLIVRYRNRRYMVHSSSPIGQYSDEAHETTGPSYDGFTLTVSLQEAGTVNAPLTPQTIREPYWHTYLDVTQIAGTAKQAYWRLSYGLRTDPEIFERLTRILPRLDGSRELTPRPGTDSNPPSCPKSMNELTGILHSATKALSPYTLVIDGCTESLYVRGELLKEIEEGSRIWVAGRIHSVLCGPHQDKTAAFVPQWHLYMQVEECQQISEPFELPGG